MIGKPLPTDRKVDRAEVITPSPPHGPAQICHQALRGCQAGGGGGAGGEGRSRGRGLDEKKTLSKREIDG